MRIVVEGNIGSGKSTVIRGIKWKLGVVVHPEPVERWVELLRRYYADPASAAMDLQVRVLLDLASVRDDDGSVHVVERSPDASVEVFGEITKKNGWISDAQLETLRATKRAFGWTADAVVFVDAPVETCFERVKARSISRSGNGAETEPGDATYLEEVASGYETMLANLTCPVVRVDGTDSAEIVLENVVAAIRKIAGAL
jgi:deoxyadenosine/deoxycytidine kinase